LPELTVTERAIVRGECVDGARDELLAGAALAWIRIVERLGAAWMIRSNTCRMRGAAADDVRERCCMLLRFWRSDAVLGDQRPALERVLHTTSTSSFLNGLVM
jgi:hypothetical protein